MNTPEKTIQFLGIGDTVIDAFIALDENFAHMEKETDGNELCMAFGSKLPYKSVKEVVAVGNAANASVSAARLGLNAALMTHLGKDENGDKCLDALVERNVNTEFVIQEADKSTNYHYVLRLGAERTILIKHDTFTYDLEKQVAGKALPKWVYFSSVGEHGLPYHSDIANWVKENNLKMAFQPGTFQISLGHAKLKDVYEACELFFCNVEEARQILVPVFGDEMKTAEPKVLLQKMHSLGPNIVAITNGKEGAYAYDGTEGFYMPIYPDPKPPLERTGAGDSFSSAFTAAIAQGLGLEVALSWGPINSMNVVQHIGAQEGLITMPELLKFLEEKPEDYVAKKII